MLDALVAIMQNATRPDVLDVQRLLLQRLAYQGDVFPSRIPTPANITEVGGYLNLLESLGQQDMRVSAVASALGIAAPPPDSVSVTGVVPVGFIDFANDRPPGRAQASIPTTICRNGSSRPLTGGVSGNGVGRSRYRPTRNCAT